MQLHGIENCQIQGFQGKWTVTHKRYSYPCIFMHNRRSEKRRMTYVPTQAEVLIIRGQIRIIPLMHTLETRV